MLYQPIRLGHILSLAWVAAVLLPLSLWAPTTPARDTLLARLTAEAIAASPSLQQSRALARASEARVQAAGALPDPMLSAGVMNLTLPRFAFKQSDFTEVDVELSQEFPWPGTLGARTRVAEAQAKGHLAEASARRREIVVRTAELYYRLRYRGRDRHQQVRDGIRTAKRSASGPGRFGEARRRRRRSRRATGHAGSPAEGDSKRPWLRDTATGDDPAGGHSASFARRRAAVSAST
jgi:outer membrane protein TolC